MSTETVTLNSGYRMPIVGLGTWQAATADECKNAVRAALNEGYRHIDTAAAYKNEEYIGEVLEEYFNDGRLKREDIFVTTKLWATFHEKDRVSLCLDQSLKKLKLEYVDLYLIHAPFAFRETGMGSFYPMDENNKPAFKDVKVEETWEGMEQCVKAGKAKSIGVSNFTIQQVERICKVAQIKPCTNQVECHIYLQQPKLFNYMKERGITLTAYSPFGSPGRPDYLKKTGEPKVLDDPVAKEMAAKYNKSVGQTWPMFYEAILALRRRKSDSLSLAYDGPSGPVSKATFALRLAYRFASCHYNGVMPTCTGEQIVFDFKLEAADMATLEGQDRNLRYFRGEVFKEHPEFSEEDIYGETK